MDKVRLGDVCTVVSGSTPKTGVPEFWDGDIDWITPAELTDETYVITESARKITEDAVKKTGLKSFPAGTVILSSRAPIGKVAIAGKEMYCNQGFKNLICSDRINAYFLFWFLRGNTEYLNSLGRGATFKEISKSIVENIKIQLPSMPEQIHCAQTLKQVWDVIVLRRQQLTALDTLIKARFVEMFGDPLDGQREWKKEEMRYVCNKITDGEHGSVPRIENGYPFLSAKHIGKNGVISWTTATYIADEVHEKIYKRCNPEVGDILLTTTGTIGNVAIVPDMSPFSMDRGITLLKLNHQYVESQFMAWLLRFDSMQSIMNANIHASAIGHLFINKVKKLPVIVPPLELQNQFAAFVAQVDKSKLAVQKALDEAQFLFDSLMQQYFG